MSAVSALERECPRANADCDATAKIQRSTATPPAGAAGFELGMSDTEAEKRCRAAGEMWSVDRGRIATATCSGSVGTPLPFHVDLQLCDGNVCRIVLSQHLAEAAHAADRWSAVVNELSQKYGPAAASELKIPDDCKVLAECVHRGRAKAQATWAWGSGHVVEAALGAPSDAHVFVFVVYSAPAVVKAVSTLGL